MPLVLPSENVIVEILESVPPSNEVIAACKKFKELYKASTSQILPKDFTKLYLEAYEWATLIRYE